jgi:hypothetical protein
MSLECHRPADFVLAAHESRVAAGRGLSTSVAPYHNLESTLRLPEGGSEMLAGRASTLNIA